MKGHFQFHFVATLGILAVAGCDSNVPSRSSSETQTEKKQTAVKKEKPEPTKRALLVGCTWYDAAPHQFNLRGPNNDVWLMYEMLVERFEFPQKNIDMLADFRDRASIRPTKKNIKERFERLGKRSKAGDQVVIYLSGHGSQIEDDDPDSPADIEPDGMDEAFLPADVKAELSKNGDVEFSNYVRDDEIRKWLNTIRSKGASVWFIVDACHSGTLTRGTRVVRHMPIEALLPEGTPPEATKTDAIRKATTRGTKIKETLTIEADGNQGGLVAMYASQPHEPTFEALIPEDLETGKFHGFLTYHLVQAVSECKDTLTYHELVQRIHAAYMERGVRGPVPLIEGIDQHNEILGQKKWPARSRLMLSKAGNDWTLNAGSLHGLTNGTILAVFPPAGEDQPNKPIGHIKVHQIGPAFVRASACEFADIPLEKDLPVGGRCKVVQLDYGELKLKISVHESTDNMFPADSKSSIQSALEEISSREASLIEIVDDSSNADWLVIPFSENQVSLSPASGWLNDGKNQAEAFGPAPVDDRISRWLDDRLGRIARATNLVRVSAQSAAQKKRGIISKLLGRNKPLGVRVELLRLVDQDDQEGTPIQWKQDGMKLNPGELISLRVHNTSKKQVDVSLLFVDSGYGIHTLFPQPGTVVDNRIEPQSTQTIGPMQIEDTSLGLEHLVVIAVRSEGQPLDFSWLAQDSLQRVHAATSTRSAQQQSFDSPLGRLLQQAIFASGNTRGISSADSSNISIQLVSWNTSR